MSTQKRDVHGGEDFAFPGVYICMCIQYTECVDPTVHRGEDAGDFEFPGVYICMCIQYT